MAEGLPRKTEKPWGFELLFAYTPKYAGKLIFVRKGHRLSLQYHEQKDETMYIYAGRAVLETEEKGSLVTSVMEAGQCIRIPPLTRHRIQAIEDTTICEVSTAELGDVVRLADDYGRSGTKAD